MICDCRVAIDVRTQAAAERREKDIDGGDVAHAGFLGPTACDKAALRTIA